MMKNNAAVWKKSSKLSWEHFVIIYLYKTKQNFKLQPNRAGNSDSFLYFLCHSAWTAYSVKVLKKSNQPNPPHSQSVDIQQSSITR